MAYAVGLRYCRRHADMRGVRRAAHMRADTAVSGVPRSERAHAACARVRVCSVSLF